MLGRHGSVIVLDHQEKYEVFNFNYSSLQNIIERDFGVLKEKWRILKGIPSFSTRTKNHIILACLALHNFIHDSNLHDKEFERCDVNDEYLVEEDDTTPKDET